MAEPANTAVAGIALATGGAITLGGSILGLQYDALLFGLFGGLMSLMHLPPMGLGRLVSTLASASLLGALFGPAAVAVARSQWAWMAVLPVGVPRLGCALLIGLFAQALIPVVLAWLDRRRATAQNGGQP